MSSEAPSNDLNGLIDQIVLGRLIEKAIGFETDVPDFKTRVLDPALERLGLKTREREDLRPAAIAEDMQVVFRMSKPDSEKIAGYIVAADERRSRGAISRSSLPPGADRALITWAQKAPQELQLLAGPRQYSSSEGSVKPVRSQIREGRATPTGRSYFFCVFREGNVLLTLDDVDWQENGFPRWGWQTAVVWAERRPEAETLLELLAQRVEQHLIGERRGKILSSVYKPVELKTYRLQDLAYPTRIRGDVEDLVNAFEYWQSPECPVPQWGAALIGPPGTGKTTVAGLLLGRKLPYCTVLYCSASDFHNLPPNTNVQHVIRDVLGWIGRLSPVLWVVDDLDLIIPPRGNGYLDPVTSCFMEGLDSLSSNARLFTVFTTNRPDDVESAILNRPGRTGTRISFGGFDECFPELLRCQASLHCLSCDDAVLQAVVASDVYRNFGQVVDLTPDMAKNVMRRVALTGASACSEQLIGRELEATARAFGKAKK